MFLEKFPNTFLKNKSGETYKSNSKGILEKIHGAIPSRTSCGILSRILGAFPDGIPVVNRGHFSKEISVEGAR